MRLSVFLIVSVYVILLNFSHVAIGVTKSQSSAGSKNLAVKTQPTTSKKDGPALVRIPLTMKPFAQILIRTPEGEPVNHIREEAEMIYTLRGKINEPNHFYFADWHVETSPKQWRAEIREYAVTLSFYRTYGANRELEEKVGTLDLSGNLVPSDERVFNLIAKKEMIFKNPHGEKILAVKAGFDPKELTRPTIVRREDR